MDVITGNKNNNAYLAGLYSGEPYVSGEQPGLGVVKLNTNENPYPPAPGVLRALADFDGRGLRLYPKQDGGMLREAIAALHGVAVEKVFVGNGSDEVLALAFRACFGLGRDCPVLFPDISYSFYPVWCEFFGIPYEAVPLGEDLLPAADGYARHNGGIVICEPNAPTSLAAGEAFVSEVIEANGGVSVVGGDEAYADFCDYSAIPLTANVKNLLVTRSFSKGRSLAGLRIGYAIGDARLIEALMAAKDSYNSYPIGAFAEALGMAAIADDDYYRMVVDKIRQTRDAVAARLREHGFDVPEPSGNFVFVGCGSAERAREIYAYLRSGGVYVRYFDKARIDDRLRVSIGKPEDMEVFFARLEEYLAI
ncbi:MAG: aminotransferase class I/II-fold pyridoxal phosphate-dependent enzyme [Clostridiales bacterium]|nr:aminotransferase class I/II-fold pyridoxal phosphate-dependent enzyme [Clostridiales bacterium]